MDRMLGNSWRRLSWCGSVVASQTPIVRRVVELVAQEEHDFVSHVDGETAEHRPGFRGQRGNRFEHEGVRNRLFRLEDQGHARSSAQSCRCLLRSRRSAQR